MNKKVVLPIRPSVGDNQLLIAGKLNEIFISLGYEVSVLNLDMESNPWMLQAYIEQQQAGLFATIDCVGFELKLIGDDLFYNSLCIPSMNFLTKSPKEFVDELSERMNFTMEFYTKDEEDAMYITENFYRVPSVKSFNVERENLVSIKEFIEKELEEII